jgi:hypothetical protein
VEKLNTEYTNGFFQQENAEGLDEESNEKLLEILIKSLLEFFNEIL